MMMDRTEIGNFSSFDKSFIKAEVEKHYSHTVTSWRKVHEKQEKFIWAHPSHAYFPLSCEGGLPFCMFLPGGRSTTFLEFASRSGEWFDNSLKNLRDQGKDN